MKSLPNPVVKNVKKKKKTKYTALNGKEPAISDVKKLFE